MYGKRTLVIIDEECIICIPGVWETYIIGVECIMWVPCVWDEE